MIHFTIYSNANKIMTVIGTVNTHIHPQTVLVACGNSLVLHLLSNSHPGTQSSPFCLCILNLEHRVFHSWNPTVLCFFWSLYSFEPSGSEIQPTVVLSIAYCFTWLRSILLYNRSTIFLSIYLLMDPDAGKRLRAKGGEGWQRMRRWWDGITNSKDMNLNRFWEREWGTEGLVCSSLWHHESWTWLGNWVTTTTC